MWPRVKMSFIPLVYAITVAPISPLCPPPLPQSVPTPLSMCMGPSSTYLMYFLWENCRLFSFLFHCLYNFKLYNVVREKYTLEGKNLLPFWWLHNGLFSFSKQKLLASNVNLKDVIVLFWFFNWSIVYRWWNPPISSEQLMILVSVPSCAATARSSWDLSLPPEVPQCACAVPPVSQPRPPLRTLCVCRCALSGKTT